MNSIYISNRDNLSNPVWIKIQSQSLSLTMLYFPMVQTHISPFAGSLEHVPFWVFKNVDQIAKWPIWPDVDVCTFTIGAGHQHRTQKTRAVCITYHKLVPLISNRYSANTHTHTTTHTYTHTHWYTNTRGAVVPNSNPRMDHSNTLGKPSR